MKTSAFKSSSNFFKSTFATFLTIGFLALFLNGCATTADKLDKFDQATRGYEKALRWAKFDMAYSYVKWDTGEPPSIPKHLGSIRLTNYRIVNRNFDEPSMTAKQTVTIHYYNQNDLRERNLEDRQEWKFFKDENRWYLISKPPTFE